MIRLASTSTRNRLPFLLSGANTSMAAEVGTHRGEFADVLLSNYTGTLYCIDHWAVPKGYEGQASRLPARGKTREDDLTMTLRRLERFFPRAKIWRTTSAEASLSFPDGSLDFVYLDGDHERPGIDRDLAAWWPKVRPGGLLAGHDWMSPGEEEEWNWARYVQPAVYGFIQDLWTSQHLALDLYIIPEENGLPWSFYLIKPEAK